MSETQTKLNLEAHKNSVALNTVHQVAKKNFKAFIFLLPIMLFLTYLGHQIHLDNPLETSIIALWFLHIGLQIGWIAGLGGILLVLKNMEKQINK